MKENYWRTVNIYNRSITGRCVDGNNIDEYWSNEIESIKRRHKKIRKQKEEKDGFNN